MENRTLGTKVSRIQESIHAADIELTSGGLREIQSAVSEIMVGGGRCPEELEPRTGP